MAEKRDPPTYSEATEGKTSRDSEANLDKRNWVYTYLIDVKSNLFYVTSRFSAKTGAGLKWKAFFFRWRFACHFDTVVNLKVVNYLTIVIKSFSQSDSKIIAL